MTVLDCDGFTVPRLHHNAPHWRPEVCATHCVPGILQQNLPKVKSNTCSVPYPWKNTKHRDKRIKTMVFSKGTLQKSSAGWQLHQLLKSSN